MKKLLANNLGEGYINTAVIIIIAVVIGGLLLGGLYLLFAGENGVYNQLNSEIDHMVNTGGTIQLKNQSNQLMYSYDGETWEVAQTKGVLEGSTLKQLTSITKNDQKVWLAVYRNSNSDKVYSSLDGVNWTALYSGSSISIMTYSNSVAVNYADGRRYESSDGINWRMTSTKDY
jgi:hypothetical protein